MVLEQKMYMWLVCDNDTLFRLLENHTLKKTRRFKHKFPKYQMTAKATREGAQDDGKAARATNKNQKWSITVTKGAQVCELKKK